MKNTFTNTLVISLFVAAAILPGTAAAAETLKVYLEAPDATIDSINNVSDWDFNQNATTGMHFSRDNGAFVFAHSSNIAILRHLFAFDTSVLPDDAVILSAQLGIYPHIIHNDDNDEYAYMNVYQGLQTSPTVYDLSDYSKCGDSVDFPTPGAAAVDIDDITANRYFEFDFSAVGTSWIVKDGYTKLCIREGHDVEDQKIDGTFYSYSGLRWNAHEESIGTTTMPYLEITYELPDGPVEEDEYELYTQVHSPYPSTVETASWADLTYASGRGALGSYPCGTTIAQCGCAITSLVMAAQNAGIDTSITESEINPSTVNAYLDSVGGYNSVGSLYWLAFQMFVGSFTDDGTAVVSRFTDFSSAYGGEVDSVLQSNLAVPGTYAALGYKNGHFVWLPAQVDDSYVVRDPWWYDTKTSNDTRTASDTYIRDYDDTFDSARFIKIVDQPQVLPAYGVEAYITGTAELLYQNLSGDQVGYGADGVVVNLGSAWYEAGTPVSLQGVGEIDSKHLLVQSDDGSFTLEVIGTDVGTYELELFTVAASGEIQTYAFTGQTFPGVTTVFSFDLETGEVVEELIDLVNFQAMLDSLLRGESAQNQQFFKKWAVKIYDGFEEKTVSQSLQQIEVYKKLFIAKKIETARWANAVELLEMRLLE